MNIDCFAAFSTDLSHGPLNKLNTIQLDVKAFSTKENPLHKRSCCDLALTNNWLGNVSMDNG